MSDSTSKGTGKTSMIMLIVYLLSSVFAGLIFSLLVMKAKASGSSAISWGILSLICIGLFGYMGYAFYVTSSPTIDPFWYYFGITSIVSNIIALFIIILALIKSN